MTTNEYAAVPLEILMFLADLSKVLAAARFSNVVFEYEAKLIAAELDRRRLIGEI